MSLKIIIIVLTHVHAHLHGLTCIQARGFHGGSLDGSAFCTNNQDVTCISYNGSFVRLRLLSHWYM